MTVTNPQVILDLLNFEMIERHKGGLYHKSQVAFAYNSNRIEGGKISEDETAQIFETGSLLFSKDEAKPVNDIIETVNHFKVFDFVLASVTKMLDAKYIKELHKLLKQGIQISKSDYQIIGDWKKYPNTVGDFETSKPKSVDSDIRLLIDEFNQKKEVQLADIAKFHYDFERIHPFFDGNGRVGRLIMFKQCLQFGVFPFVLLDEQKPYYYRGLKEFANDVTFLIETFGQAQDVYMRTVDYFMSGIYKGKTNVN